MHTLAAEIRARIDQPAVPLSVRRSLTQHTYTTPALAALESQLLGWGA